MKKIPTVFRRDPDDMKRVLPEVTPGCEWVLAGEGEATRKYDGTCVMFDGHDWWARRIVKKGKTEPPNFDAVETDPITGHTVGWEPIDQSGFAKMYAEAVENWAILPSALEAGTYELVGPKINGNPEGLTEHILVRHGYLAAVEWDAYASAPRDIDTLPSWLREHEGEGIVWHHPDGRMAKLKRRDFPTER